MSQITSGVWADSRGRVWFDGQDWKVSALTGSAVRLTSASAARTVLVTSLCERAHDLDIAAIEEGSTRWTSSRR